MAKTDSSATARAISAETGCPSASRLVTVKSPFSPGRYSSRSASTRTSRICRVGDGELLPVRFHSELSHAGRGEEHVGNEVLLHLDLDQPVVSVEIDDAQVVEVLPFHAEEHEATRRGGVEQHGERTPHLHRARVDQDLDAGSLIVEIARLLRGREHEGLRANRHLSLRLAHPGDPVVALLLHLEAQLRSAVLTRPQLLRRHELRLVALEAESPGPLAPALGRRKADPLGAELRQLLAAHLATGRIQPDLPPRSRVIVTCPSIATAARWRPGRGRRRGRCLRCGGRGAPDAGRRTRACGLPGASPAR